MCFDQLALSNALNAALRFSPLFIGACVSTLIPFTRWNRSSCFSPLFIGACVSTLSSCWSAGYLDHVSVPSSSGHVFRLYFASLLSGPENTFQSPLHRGMCFDVYHGRPDTAFDVVSVPSSSGHVFRQGCLQNAWQSANTFQSPLHRGMCFDKNAGTRV